MSRHIFLDILALASKSSLLKEKNISKTGLKNGGVIIQK